MVNLDGMDSLADMELPPIIAFKEQLNTYEEIILTSNSLKLSTLRPQKEFLKKLCLFILEEVLLHTSKCTVTEFLDSILNMDKSVKDLLLIQNEVTDNVIIQIMVSAVTKINLFSSSAYTKKQKRKMLGTYVQWCGETDMGGDVTPIIKLDDLVLRLKDLQERKGKAFTNTDLIESNGRSVQVHSMDACGVFDLGTCPEAGEKLQKYFIYTPAGVYAVGDRDKHKFVFWNSTLKGIQSGLCAMLR